MADTYLLDGTSNPTTDWTTSVVLDRDKDGNPSKVIGTSQPSELSADDKKTLKSLGFEVRKATEEDVREAQVRAVSGATDTSSAAPVLGDGETDQG